MGFELIEKQNSSKITYWTT